MIKLLVKRFFRSKGSVIALLLVWILGMISLSVGKHFLQKKEEIIEQVVAKKQKNTLKNIENNANDLGLFLYYQKFGLVNRTPALAGLAIGLRKTNPTIKEVTIRNLEEQKYASELTNPFYQLFGNMDFSFVLIYFFPLAIIILCFNIVSEEKETKRWSMLLVQSGSPLKTIYIKMFIRYLLTIGIALMLLLSGKFYLDIPFSESFFVFVLMSVLYLSLWFSLCALIISFNMSGSANLLSALALWIALSVIAPAVLNVMTKAYFPIPETYATALKSREGYHEKWDMDKDATINRFQAAYPQFSDYNHPPEKAFSWLWYYAMQHMGDVEAQDDARKLFEKLSQRIHFIRSAGAFFPPIHTQLSLTRLARSDLKNYTHFLAALEDLHGEKRLYFYPKIFTDNVVKKDDWKSDNTVSYYNEQRQPSILFMMTPFIMGLVVTIFWARKNFIRYLLK